MQSYSRLTALSGMWSSVGTNSWIAYVESTCFFRGTGSSIKGDHISLKRITHVSIAKEAILIEVKQVNVHLGITL